MRYQHADLPIVVECSRSAEITNVANAIMAAADTVVVVPVAAVDSSCIIVCSSVRAKVLCGGARALRRFTRLQPNSHRDNSNRGIHVIL